jgi:hypothetical protein
MPLLKSFLIFFCIFNILCSWCDSNNDPDTPEGSYTYTAYDSTGVKIVEGWMKLVFDDSVNVSGKWNFKKIGNPENIGPQVGSGKLVGWFDEPTISINLNPNWADNNVFFHGDYSENIIEGEWMYSGFPGVINKGMFKAVK